MASTGGVKIGGTYDEARTRKMNAEAELSELDLAKVRNQLVIVEDVVKAWTDTLANLKSKVTSIPSKAAPIMWLAKRRLVYPRNLDGFPITKHWKNYQLMTQKFQRARTSKPKGASAGSDDDTEAATPPKRKRVGRPSKATRLAD